MRRMITAAILADKLGYSIDSWYSYGRADMEREGLPEPFRGKGKGQHAYWDSAAIDAWLDSKMDAGLRTEKDSVRAAIGANGKDWSAILEQRLERQAAA